MDAFTISMLPTYFEANPPKLVEPTLSATLYFNLNALPIRMQPAYFRKPTSDLLSTLTISMQPTYFTSYTTFCLPKPSPKLYFYPSHPYQHSHRSVGPSVLRAPAEQTKVTTVLGINLFLLPPLFKTTEGVVVLFQIFACGPELPIE